MRHGGGGGGSPAADQLQLRTPPHLSVRLSRRLPRLEEDGQAEVGDDGGEV